SVDDGQLPNLTKRSVRSLMHFARTALWHHHETTAGQILDRGSAAPTMRPLGRLKKMSGAASLKRLGSDVPTRQDKQCANLPFCFAAANQRRKPPRKCRNPCRNGSPGSRS